MALEVQPNPAPPSPLRLALSALAGLTLGLGLVAWSMNPLRPGTEGDESFTAPDGEEPEAPSEEPRSETESNPDAGIETGAVAASDSASASASASASESDSESDSESASESELDTRDDAPVADPPTFERGRVAYLRCGEPEVRCGRDRDFEEAAWAVLAELPTCGALAGRRGAADIRIHRSGGETELRFRDWGDTALPAGPLQSCLGPTLPGLAIGVEGSPLIVSFRFRLR